MRSFVICLLFVTLIGDALCGRLRRQAPPGGPPAGIPEGGAAIDGPPIPEGGAAVDGPPIPEGGAAIDGPPEGVTPPANTKADGLNNVIGILLNDVNTKAALGLPVDPKKVDTILKLSMVISIIGGEVSESNKEGIENLLAASPEAVDGPADV